MAFETLRKMGGIITATFNVSHYQYDNLLLIEDIVSHGTGSICFHISNKDIFLNLLNSGLLHDSPMVREVFSKYSDFFLKEENKWILKSLTNSVFGISMLIRITEGNSKYLKRSNYVKFSYNFAFEVTQFISQSNYIDNLNKDYLNMIFELNYEYLVDKEYFKLFWKENITSYLERDEYDKIGIPRDYEIVDFDSFLKKIKTGAGLVNWYGFYCFYYIIMSAIAYTRYTTAEHLKFDIDDLKYILEQASAGGYFIPGIPECLLNYIVQIDKFFLKRMIEKNINETLPCNIMYIAKNDEVLNSLKELQNKTEVLIRLNNFFNILDNYSDHVNKINSLKEQLDHIMLDDILVFGNTMKMKDEISLYSKEIVYLNENKRLPLLNAVKKIINRLSV